MVWGSQLTTTPKKTWTHDCSFWGTSEWTEPHKNEWWVVLGYLGASNGNMGPKIKIYVKIKVGKWFVIVEKGLWNMANVGEC